MKIKMFVATHKEAEMPNDKNTYVPILVMPEKNKDAEKLKKENNYQLDNEGDNISLKNKNYSELTAIYWMWKNVKNVDAVGLVHYRRFFSHSIFDSRKIENVLNKDQIEELLNKAPIILPTKRYYFVETIKSHYIHSHYQEPLDVMIDVIKKDYPKYYKPLEETLNKRSAHLFNMFIMKEDYFNKYCEFIFSVLFKVEKKVDISSYNATEARVFGYLSELLMDAWISANNYDYIESNYIQLGDRHLIKKGVELLKRKIKPDIEKNETHFE